MLKISIQNIANNSPYFPKDLQQIAHAPHSLYIQSKQWPELMTLPRVAVVGSRNLSPYGKEITHRLASELARAGVVIVSGLAYGVDSVAHRAALEVGGLTMAVLPSDLYHIYPSYHQPLARQIVEAGGALVSEYNTNAPTYKSNFIARNRIVGGLAHVLLVTEAVEKSGTFHTVRFALEQGKDVLAVPGNITSPQSIGTNNLIKSGATVVTQSKDILCILGLQPAISTTPKNDDPCQQALLTLLAQGAKQGETLQTQSQLSVTEYNQALTMLEISGQIRPLGNNIWTLA
jgi:DNA processing protein